MREPLRVGVIGCGAMGQEHVGLWTRTPGARITAVCDPNPIRAEEVAHRFEVHGYAGLDAMLDSGTIDAVDICTPSGLHADQGLAAAACGLHVLMEKPLDVNAEKARRLVEQCEERGLTLACIFQKRTYPAIRTVAEAIHTGQMGQLLSASAYVKWWRPQSYYDSSPWRGTWSLDGGALANQAIHALDLLCWLAGEVEEVEYAHVTAALHTMESEDSTLAVVRFANGARGVIEATTCCLPDLCTRLEVYGSHGAAALDDVNVIKFGLCGEDRMPTLPAQGAKVGGGAEAMAISLEGHAIHLTDFVEAIRDRRPPLVSGRDALVSVEALNKIYRKALPDVKLGT